MFAIEDVSLHQPQLWHWSMWSGFGKVWVFSTKYNVEAQSIGDPIWIWPRSGPAEFSTQSALLWLSVLASCMEQTPVCLGFNLYLFCIYMACFLYTEVLASILKCFSWCPKYHLKDTNEIDRHPCMCETWMGSVDSYWWSWKPLALEVSSVIDLMFPGDN